jgi:thiol-disulfide isomerase/thioredoxin
VNRTLIAFFAVLLAALVSAQTAAPTKHQLFEVKLKDKELLKMATGKEMSLPQLRIYNNQGQMVADFSSGFDDDTFKEDFDKALQSPKPMTGKPALKSALNLVVDMKNKSVKDLPPADFTIVEYWAGWCEPCHQQLALLNEALKAHEATTINFMHVEADPTKLPGMKVEDQK